MPVTQSIFYRLADPAATVRLRVLTGQAQKGATVVQHGCTLVTTTNDDEVTVELGTAEEMRGQKIHCTTVVTDVNPQTNLTSVSWELTGGAETYTKTSTETLDHSGDSVLYVAAITFL